MVRLTCLFALIAGLALPASAEAGAWTKRKYEGLVIAGLGMHWLDPYAQPANRGHLKIEASLYVEFGLTDRITLVGRGAFQQLHQRITAFKKKPAPPVSGIGGIELGARVQLLQRGRWAVAGQVMAGIPGSGENWINQAFGARGGDVDTRLLVGRSIGEGAFVELSAGMRHRGDNASDEIRVDLTAGSDFLFGTRVMAQTYSVWAVDSDRQHVSYTGHRFQASLLLPTSGKSMVQISALTTVNQQRMSEEFAVTASIWRSF